MSAKEEWSKIPVEMCKQIVINYENHLTVVMKNKSFAIDYWEWIIVDMKFFVKSFKKNILC